MRYNTQVVYITFFLILTSLFGGMLTFKANAALPNESLYAYKLTVNENIENFIANSTESKARLDLFLIKERLQEAQTLAKRGILDSYAQHTISQNIQLHIDNITHTITDLQKSGATAQAATLASTLHTTLQEQSASTASVSSLGSTNLQIALAPILTKLRTTTSTVALISNKIQIVAMESSATKKHSAVIESSHTNAKIPELKKQEVQYFIK